MPPPEGGAHKCGLGAALTDWYGSTFWHEEEGDEREAEDMAKAIAAAYLAAKEGK